MCRRHWDQGIPEILSPSHCQKSPLALAGVGTTVPPFIARGAYIIIISRIHLIILMLYIILRLSMYMYYAVYLNHALECRHVVALYQHCHTHNGYFGGNGLPDTR